MVANYRIQVAFTDFSLLIIANSVRTFTTYNHYYPVDNC